MLNKEMLLFSAKKDDGDITIVVGDDDRTSCGYEKGSFGSIDRVPYWNDKKLEEPFYLFNITGSYSIGFTQLILLPVHADPIDCRNTTISIEVTKTGDKCSINCAVQTTNQGVVTEKSGVIRGGLWSVFTDNIGKALSLKFTPPPDGYM